MKKVNSILELLGVSALALLIFELTMYYVNDLWYRVGILSVGLILCIVVYILSRKYENVLEMELEYVKDKLQEYKDNEQELISEIERLEINLVDMKRERDEWKEKFNEEIEEPHPIPFSEDSQPQEQGYICPQCNSSNVRETTHYVICNDCGKRKKKSTYGVKLTKNE